MVTILPGRLAGTYKVPFDLELSLPNLPGPIQVCSMYCVALMQCLCDSVCGFDLCLLVCVPCDER